MAKFRFGKGKGEGKDKGKVHGKARFAKFRKLSSKGQAKRQARALSKDWNEEANG